MVEKTGSTLVLVTVTRTSSLRAPAPSVAVMRILYSPAWVESGCQVNSPVARSNCVPRGNGPVDVPVTSDAVKWTESPSSSSAEARNDNVCPSAMVCEPIGSRFGRTFVSRTVKVIVCEVDRGTSAPSFPLSVTVKEIVCGPISEAVGVHWNVASP